MFYEALIGLIGPISTYKTYIFKEAFIKHYLDGAMSYVCRAMLCERGAMSYNPKAMLCERRALL